MTHPSSPPPLNRRAPRAIAWLACLVTSLLVVPGAGCTPSEEGDRPEAPVEASAGGSVSADCFGDGASDDEYRAGRAGILDWIAERRSEEGLEPLTADPGLCEVAQWRAGVVARAGRVESTGGTITSVSRRLLATGYEAHRWIERSILGYRTPVRLVESWALSGGGSFEAAVLGDYEQVGVGVADVGEGTAVVLLFATPRSSWFREQVAGLEDLAEVRRRVLERVNEVRKEEGLPPVRSDPDLDRAAQAHALDMRDRGYYAHVSPQGLAPRDWVDRTDYGPFHLLSENIAKGLFEPAEAVDRWLESREHRRNILEGDATETGLGVAWGEVGGTYEVYWVQLFARPR